MSGAGAAAARPRWIRLIGDPSRPAEHSVALRAAALVAVLAAVGGTLSTGVGGWDFGALPFPLIAVGAAVSYMRRDRIGPLSQWTQTLTTLAMFVVSVVAYRGARPAELVVPLLSLLVGIEAVRSFGLRSRSDLRLTLVLATALVAVGGSRSLSMGFAPFLAVWAAATGLALMLAHRSELAELAGGRVARPLPVGPAATALVAALAVAAVAFLVIPAARSSRVLAFAAHLPAVRPVAHQGGLSNPSLGAADPDGGGSGGTAGAPASFGYPGFTDHLDTSVRGRPDDTLVMRVRAAAPDFWRGQTFDRWDGRTWTLSDERTLPIRGRDAVTVYDPPDDPPASGPELIQTFYIETAGPNLIFGANRPSRVYLPQSTLFELTDGTLRTGVELDRGAVYTVVSRRPQTTVAAMRAAGDSATRSPAAILARYTQLPVMPDRIRALATDVAGGAPTTYDRVRALEAWMAANTRYRIDIPPLPDGEDAVDRFLFVDRTGFCEQIGSSLVVMLRSLGVPARLAVGYAPGERNPFTGVFDVRARDAHAWAEVYFPGLGWQAFDPTASVPLAGDPQSGAARAGLSGYLARHLRTVVALTAALAAGLLAAWSRPLLAWWRRRRRTDRGWADLQLGRLEAVGRGLGRPREDGETAQEYASALGRSVLRDPHLPEIGAALGADAFGLEPLPEAERDRIASLIGALDGG